MRINKFFFLASILTLLFSCRPDDVLDDINDGANIESMDCDLLIPLDLYDQYCDGVAATILHNQNEDITCSKIFLKDENRLSVTISLYTDVRSANILFDQLYPQGNSVNIGAESRYYTIDEYGERAFTLVFRKQNIHVSITSAEALEDICIAEEDILAIGRNIESNL